MADAQFADASAFRRKVQENGRVYWQDGASLAQVMASGEVTVAWAWNETPVTMQAEGHPIGMKRDTKEGLSTWVCGYSMLAGGVGDEQKAYAYINAFLADVTADSMVISWGYGHPNQAAIDQLDPKVLVGMG